MTNILHDLWCYTPSFVGYLQHYQKLIKMAKGVTHPHLLGTYIPRPIYFLPREVLQPQISKTPSAKNPPRSVINEHQIQIYKRPSVNKKLILCSIRKPISKKQ